MEPNKGYGSACLKGIEYIQNSNQKTDIVVFLDGDYSDYPEQMSEIIAPILNQNTDFVLGSRKKSLSEKGAMQPQQRFGNWLATNLMRLFFNSKFTDLGPFRAIKYEVLQQLGMKDKTYGWTVEMQLKILISSHVYQYMKRYTNSNGDSNVSS